MTTKIDLTEAGGHYANYDKYASTLRAWLVAFGIGGPVLFVSNDKLTDRIVTSGHGTVILTLYLFGVATQVAVAAIDKWAAWDLYSGELDPELKAHLTYRIWHRINDQVWIDISADVLAMLSFFVATWYVCTIFLASHR